MFSNEKQDSFRVITGLVLNMAQTSSQTVIGNNVIEICDMQYAICSTVAGKNFSPFLLTVPPLGYLRPLSSP